MKWNILWLGALKYIRFIYPWQLKVGILFKLSTDTKRANYSVYGVKNYLHMTVTVIRRDTAGEIPFDAMHKNAPASVRATAGIDIDEPSPEKTIITQLVTIVNTIIVKIKHTVLYVFR